MKPSVFFFLDLEVYHIRSIFYSKQIISWKSDIKSKRGIEILSNLDIAERMEFLFIHPFTPEEITGCTNKAVKGANKAEINLFSCFFIFILCLMSQ